MEPCCARLHARMHARMRSRPVNGWSDSQRNSHSKSTRTDAPEFRVLQIYVYYDLDNYYQNYRRCSVVRSRRQCRSHAQTK